MTIAIVHQLTRQAQAERNPHLFELAVMLLGLIQGGSDNGQ